MNEVVTNFLDTQKQLEKLKTQAKKAMQEELTNSLKSAALLFTEYKKNFGENPEVPEGISFKTNGDVKTEKRRRTSQNDSEPASNGRKLAGLRKRAATLQNKIATDRAAGKSTRNTEDKLYEVIDELRLEGVDVTAEFPGFVKKTETSDPETVSEMVPVNSANPFASGF